MSNIHPSHIQALTDFITDEKAQPKPHDLEKQIQDNNPTYQTSQVQKSQSLLTPQFKSSDTPKASAISTFKKWRKTIFFGLIVGFVLILIYMIYRKKKTRTGQQQLQGKLEQENQQQIQKYQQQKLQQEQLQSKYKQEQTTSEQTDQSPLAQDGQQVSQKQKSLDQKQKMLEQLKNKLQKPKAHEQSKLQVLTEIQEQCESGSDDEESMLLKPSCKQDKSNLQHGQTYDQSSDNIIVSQSPLIRVDQEKTAYSPPIEIHSDDENQD